MPARAPRIRRRPRVAPDPRIVHPLDQLRGTIRRFVVLDGLLAAALFLVAWFWAGLALDFGLFKLTGLDWVQDAPWALRALALLTMLVIVAVIVVSRIVSRLRKEFSYRSLALVLEKRYPKLLGDRLITAVELADVRRQERYGYSAEMIRETIAAARERVAQVPIREVFNWKRLWRRGLLAVGVMFALLFASCFVFVLVAGPARAGEFWWRSADVAGIWSERNLLLLNTPWPRQAHLELVDVPPEGLRVGKDAPPPKVRVRAYEWVRADRHSRDGWRPLRWADLKADLVGADLAVPAGLTVHEEGDWRPADFAAAGVVGGPGLGTAARPVSVREVSFADMTADEVFAAFPPLSHPETEAVHRRLDELAARPSMSRTLRHLPPPSAVTLTYRGKPTGPAARREMGSTSGSIKLTREPNGDYSAEVAGLKESVSFVVRAEDFRTEPRDIVLIPPPMLTRLTRVESQPAYLFHPAPEEPPGPDGRRPPPRFEALKGLRQVLGEKDLSLTGDKSVCSVPVGTELALTGTADKPLAKAFIQPRAGRIPGVPPGSTAPVEVPVEGDRFTVRFEGDYRITQPVEFELVLVDEDGVRSSRPVLIQAADDQPPSVEVAVDVLRKVGNTYMCTPAAMVPFVKESVVRDDTGLSRVEYQFTVTRLEAQVVVGLQVQAMAGVWAFAPVVPNLGSAFGPTASATLAGQLSKGEQKQSGTLPVTAFVLAYGGLTKDTPDLLRQKLGTPPENESGRTVKEVKFALDADAFDLETVDQLLEARGKKMRVTDPGEVQPRFRIDLEIVATDVNVETGPKVGRNLEPIRLLVVSEADLLGEINKDEEGLIGKLDDAIKKLTDAQTKFNQQSERLVGSPPPDLLLSARVRAEDIIQDVGKARDLTQVVVSEYSRLRREVDVNRVALDRATGRSKVGQQYDEKVIRPLESVQANEFKAAEGALAAFRDPLLAGVPPEPPVMLDVRSRLAELLARLTAIRGQLGEALSISKLRDDLRKLIDDRKVISKALEGIKQKTIISASQPRLKVAGAVTLAPGEKKKVKQTVEWNAFDKDEITVRVDPRGGVTTRTPEVVVKAGAGASDDFEYELTAGDKPGEYTVRLVPSVGEPVEVKVIVK